MHYLRTFKLCLVNWVDDFNWYVSVTVWYQIIIQPRTPLEEEVAAVLRGSAHVLERSNKELTEEEEKALLAMDLEEVYVLEHNEMNHMLSSEIGKFSSTMATQICSCKPQEIANLQNKSSTKISCYTVFW